MFCTGHHGELVPADLDLSEHLVPGQKADTHAVSVPRGGQRKQQGPARSTLALADLTQCTQLKCGNQIPLTGSEHLLAQPSAHKPLFTEPEGL